MTPFFPDHPLVLLMRALAPSRKPKSAEDCNSLSEALLLEHFLQPPPFSLHDQKFASMGFF